jgi:hypothetical protein
VLAVGAAARAGGVAAVSVGTVLGGGGSRFTVVPDAVALIEPENGAIAAIAVGADPRGVAVGAGSVWVAADDGL